ncbi:MAG: glycoside hydrolase family 5 protein [Phycisphaerae bacterium]
MAYEDIDNTLPRWRGFNLTFLFSQRSSGKLNEDHLRWIADWGFDFVRLPMSYRRWADPETPDQNDQSVLAEIDRAVELGRELGVHVNLNLHRAPGYCVNDHQQEPYDLWKDPEGTEAFCSQWRMFAQRYHGIPSEQLSFDLVNEPPGPGHRGFLVRDYQRVVRTASAAIRQVDPDRLIVADGISWGRQPVPELADLRVAQSCRGYEPFGISHYQASWVDGEKFPQPTWPGAESFDGNRWGRAELEAHYDPWVELIRLGSGVHCGEMGCYNRTPHDVALAWLGDLLEVLGERNIGWGLWNLDGSFGILNSGREDVEYEDFHGEKLDRKMLELLQAH